MKNNWSIADIIQTSHEACAKRLLPILSRFRLDRSGDLDRVEFRRK